MTLLFRAFDPDVRSTGTTELPLPLLGTFVT
jgi:hypothetical protein